MGLLDALGVAGGARRVDDEREIVAMRARGGEIFAGLRHQLFPCQGAPAVGGGRRTGQNYLSQHRRAPAHRLDRAVQFRGRNRDHRLAVEQDLFNLVIAQEEAGRDRDRSRLDRSENCDQRVQAGAQPQHHAFAGTHAESRERIGEAVGERAQVRERERAVFGQDRDARAAALLDVTIDDVARDIERFGNLEIGAIGLRTHRPVLIRCAAAMTARTIPW